jgi:hypothetical protein
MVESQHEMSVTAFNGLLGEYVEVEEEDDRATLVWEPRSYLIEDPSGLKIHPWIEDPSMSEPTSVKSVKTGVLERRLGQASVLMSELSDIPRDLGLPTLMRQMTLSYNETPDYCGTPGGSSSSKGGTSPSCTRTSVVPLRRNPFKSSWTHTIVEPVVPAMREEPRFRGRDSFIGLRFTKSNPSSTEDA